MLTSIERTHVEEDDIGLSQPIKSFGESFDSLDDLLDARDVPSDQSKLDQSDDDNFDSILDNIFAKK